MYTKYPSSQTGDSSKAPTFKSDEDVFLIFYFVFLLEEFSKELSNLVEALEVIRQEELKIKESRDRVWWKRIILPYSIQAVADSRRGRSRRYKQRHTFWRSIIGLFFAASPSTNLPSTRAHQENTTQTPLALTTRARVNRLIWRLGQFLKQAETKFAIKTGFGCAVLASPAFIKSTRSLFTAYKGQWALISFLVVLSPTVGQSNQISIHRILGTILGASTALLAYSLFPDNNIVLPGECELDELH